MKRIGTAHALRLCLALAIGSYSEFSHAQSASDATLGSIEQSTSSQEKVQTNDSKPETVVDYARPSAEVPALDGSGVITLSSIRRPRLLLGGTISGGFDSNPLSLAKGTMSGEYSFSPYIELQASTSRTQYLFQYHPTINRLTSYAPETMHVASARLAGSFTPRLSWTVGMTGSHGDDALRLLDPTSGTSGGTSGGGAFLPNAGMLTDLESLADLHYDASPRDSLGLILTNSYNSFSATHRSGGIASVSVNYNHSIKPSLGLLFYAQEAQYYGDIHCTGIGTGAGVRWQPRESTLISLRGGPQIDTPGCMSQQGFSYNASLSRKLPRRSQLFINADRQPVVSFLGSGLWQDDVSGGYERQFQVANTMSLEVGFIHTSTLVNSASYRGSFYAASYVRNLHKGLSLAWTYRTFMGSSSVGDVNRSIFQCSLTFTPNTRTLSR